MILWTTLCIVNEMILWTLYIINEMISWTTLYIVNANLLESSMRSIQHDLHLRLDCTYWLGLVMMQVSQAL